jgi:hypothetical protein
MAFVAEKLSPLQERIVFVGGAILSLLIENPASVPVRPTDDIDLIIDVEDRADGTAVPSRTPSTSKQQARPYASQPRRTSLR